MHRTTIALSGLFLAVFICAGCSHKTATAPAKPHEEHHHKSAHGGSLNAIVTCENGHAEAKLESDTLKIWFVCGGPNPTKSVRIPDQSINLTVKTDAGPKTLVLTPTPLELAGEKVGDCSAFEGKASWLKGLSKFTADGRIMFKGKNVPLKIEYPEGYDPD